MKKYIPLILVGLLFCSSLILKDQYLRRIDARVAISIEEERTYRIEEMLLWLPIGISGGFSLLLFPKKVILWFYDIFGAKTRAHFDNLYILRLMGVMLLAFTAAGLWSYISSGFLPGR